MNKRLLVVLVFVFGWLSPFDLDASPFHAFHTSLAQVDYDAKAKVLEVSLRVFTDDLELTLSKEANRKVKLDDNKQNDQLLEAYVRKHFGFIDSKGQPKAMTFIGKEPEVEAMWIYLEVPCPENVSGWSLRNAVLTELFDDQTNVVNLTYLGAKKTFLFKADTPVQVIAL